MGGGDTKTTNTSQSSETNPWAPAVPYLTNMLSQLGGISTSLSPGQSTALQNLQTAAGKLPDMSGGATDAVSNALGFDTSAGKGYLTDAYKSLQGNLGGTASGSELNPYDTPGFSDAIGTMTNDITNAVKGQYAGSGRDPSGAGTFAGSLGRGLTQGIAPVIQQQYNQNKQNQMNAAGTLFNAGNTTGTGVTGQDTTALQAQLQGLQGLGMLPQLLTQNANTQLGAANQAYGQPISNIGSIEQLINPIASMGGTSSGTGTSSTTSSKSLFSNILGGLSGLAGLNGAMGGGWLSGLGSGISSAIAGPFAMFSDERLKDDVTPIGETYDGKPLYSYTYKNDNTPQIGLLAQDMLDIDPGSVLMHPSGYLMVDYDRALAPSREMAEAA